MKPTLFKCKVCGSEMYLEGEPTVENIRESLKQLRHDLKGKTELSMFNECGLYSIEWSLKKMRKYRKRKPIVIEESETRKEITA